MIFSRAAALPARRTAQYLIGGVRTRTTSQAKSGPGIPSGVLAKWYNLFGSSTAAYAGWIVIGILTAEVVYGKFTDVVWASVNKGRTFDSVDWSKFASADEEEEEEDDEEEEDEDDEEGGDDDDDEE